MAHRVDRRRLLKRGIAGAALVWSSPAIDSIVLPRPAAAISALNSFSFTFGDNTSKDQPAFALTNTSPSGVDIVSFTMSIGDTAFNFDSASRLVTGNTVTSGVESLTTPDGSSGGARSDTVVWAFSSGTPGFFTTSDTFRFGTELDPDTGNTSIYTLPGPTNPQIAGWTYAQRAWQAIFWNNNHNSVTNPNTVLTVGFSDTSTVMVTVADQAFSGGALNTGSAFSSPAAISVVGTT